MSVSDTRVTVRLSSSHHNLTFHWTEKAFYVLHDVHKAGGKASLAEQAPANVIDCASGPRHSRTHDVSHHDLLRVAFDSSTRTVTVAYIKPKKKKKPHTSLVVLEGKVHGELSDEAVEAWANNLMQKLYEGILCLSYLSSCYNTFQIMALNAVGDCSYL